MTISPDLTQAFWEAGSAVFQVLNVRAIRQSKSLAGVHWIPTAFFGAWGVYNLWFYTVMGLPLAYWAGLAITCTNVVWLGHVAYYSFQRRRKFNVESSRDISRSPQGYSEDDWRGFGALQCGSSDPARATSYRACEWYGHDADFFP